MGDPTTPPEARPHTRFDHDGTWRHHHHDQTGEAVWWTNVDQFGGERREHRHVTPPEPVEAREPIDARPEVVAWFHESEEICEHDAGMPWPCEVMADALLRAFVVEPRLTEHPDGTWSFEPGHFRRLVLADDLAEMAVEPT